MAQVSHRPGINAYCRQPVIQDCETGLSIATTVTDQSCDVLFEGHYLDVGTAHMYEGCFLDVSDDGDLGLVSDLTWLYGVSANAAM